MNDLDKRSHFTVYDGTAMLFRAYFEGTSFIMNEGKEIGGVVGDARMFVSLLNLHRPRHIGVVFDAGQRTFRSTLDPQYKANRGESPEDLIPQFPLVQELARALGFATYCVKGFEADDLMATLSKMSRENGLPCRLVSVDKDLCQLVADREPSTILFNAKKRQFYDEAGVLDWIGVLPRYAIDYQALVGDSTDNIKGVVGVGPKAAKALIERFGHLETIYENLEEVSSLPIRGAKSLKRKLEEGHQSALLAKQLVTLRKDVPLEHHTDALHEQVRWNGPCHEAEAFFDRMGFSTPLRQMRGLFSDYD